MTEQPYIFTMDIYPQQVPEQNQLYKFFENLREGRLTTTQCSKCEELPWPPRTVCPKCMSNELNWVDLPKRGKLYAFTAQYAGVPYVFDTPLVVGLVEFDNGLKFFCRIVEAKPEELSIGSEVELTILEVPGNRVVHAFKPVS
ncbi:MAG: Zn-ribbon domain-containing OB-fold protein [Chloroflexi bacterium]|nr:Zn-ribbon domain-containing OB-fold protein [Chloroflexota bacterium]